MDHEHRRSPPAALKLRGSTNNYYSVNTGASLSRIPSSPLPPLPSFVSDDQVSPGNYSDPEIGGGYSRGVARFERVGTDSEGGLLSPNERMPMNRLSIMSSDTDGTRDFVPISSSPPKLCLSFDTNVLESSTLDRLDTPPSHRLSIRPSFRPRSTYGANRLSSSPERILTSPAPITRKPTVEQITIDPPSHNKTPTSNVKQLRRSSAIYKRRASQDGTETSSSKSGNSALDSPEDRDSGFHEDMDEALRSKQPSPNTTTVPARRNDGSTRSRHVTIESPGSRSTGGTPERAPLIPNEGRITPITLVDPGVVKKPVPISLPQIEKMEIFKETFSTNLFENSLPPEKRERNLSPKSITSAAKGKVMSQAEFERLRQQADDESDDDEEEEDLAKDETYQADLSRQRRRQQAALSVYRQQMTKVVGADATPTIPPQRPMSQIDSIAEADDETEEIPLAVLMAHGFPQNNNRPSSARSSSVQGNRPQVVLEPRIRSPSPGNLPVFAKNLPMDPHAAYGPPSPGLPRSSSAFDLRQASRASNAPGLGVRANSSPTIPLLDLYQSRDGKGSVYLNPSQIQAQQAQIANQMMAAQEQAYFNQMTYDVMGMQPVPTGPGMIQYVPVVVTPPAQSPSLGSSPSQTLFHQVIDRQQANEQIRQGRVSQVPQPQYPAQYPPAPPPPMIPASPPPHPMSRPESAYQRPQSVYQRPKSIYQDSRRSIYDQKSIYSHFSQQPTARPKLPSTNPAYRVSTVSNSAGRSPAASGRYRASIYAGAGAGISNVAAQSSPDLTASPINPADDDDDDGWNALLQKKQEMAARRITRMQTTA